MNRDLGLLILRLGAGALLMSHGLAKAIDLAHGRTEFADPLGLGPLPTLVLAVFAELVCAFLVVLGLKARWAAVPVVATMAVAAFVAHASDPLADKELALVYGVVFLALAFTGAGRFSLDEWWRQRRRR